ncbi:alpha-galactosidase [Schleiferilactobacillus shenzhenensis]|uniref:Alpha-galactosidase n=1 Tax=Schleiferilactobacillus shenzhenensis LY-73 TaxID=1231336 RepID=U4TT79_9LACO|nr:alpha-galactosidase [Schleiferilactobacillus shenzhenensis]ERL65088.1 AgaR [Schleiferilactobacillus shenzhenensis LY-73]
MTNPKIIVQQFDMVTAHSQMTLGVTASGHLVCLYLGARLSSQPSFQHLLTDLTHVSYLTDTDGIHDFRLEQLPIAYPAFGYPDLREPAVVVADETGSRITDLRFEHRTALARKPAISGLPSAQADEATKSWAYSLRDQALGLTVTLIISADVDHDVFTQHVVYTNKGPHALTIERAFSFNWDFLSDQYTMLDLTGAWSRETHLQMVPLHQGTQGVDSKRGASGHGQNPFIALAVPGTNWQQGQVIGVNLVYSGNFTAQATVDMHQNTRLQIGLNPFNFSWQLGPHRTFKTPEAVIVAATHGLNELSARYHEFYLDNLMRPAIARMPRPIVINNWEATYFDFDRTKLLALARQAQAVGAEMFVLDDGWFGHRDDDTTSLGDWVPNTTKLGGSLNSLIHAINGIGLHFGLWVEPEMVSLDSDLYRDHPDWIIADRKHQPQLTRSQYVLDLSRPEVQNYLMQTLDDLVSNHPIDYLKWDMNRNITDAYTATLPPRRQGEFEHRYLLGLYRILNTLVTKHPQLLIEGCAGGGGRFDAGMLAYCSTIWTSDDTDAIARLPIQAGTSLLYPAAAMSCHVSAVPNEQVGRSTPLNTRGLVAEQGALGYELDLTQLGDDELDAIKDQIGVYKALRDVLQFGQFTRLPVANPANEWAWSKQVPDCVVVDRVTVLAQPNTVTKRQRLVGLPTNAVYRERNSGRLYAADFLMAVGLPVAQPHHDYAAQRWVLERV